MNRINLVAVGVEDMSRALAFYKAIGFQTPESRESPPIVFFDNEGSKLELFPLDELAKDVDPNDPPVRPKDVFSGITFACNMKSKTEVDEMMTLVGKAGGKVVKQPQTVSWGGYSGYFRDPDGYYWELAYAEDWQFDERNMLIIEK
ncbi:MAG: VOC family protein [Alkalibacterium sp.]